jgi:putative NIF3 family GTP cyclohydrolase 1 type 2
LCNHTNTERGFLSQVLQSWLKKELDAENRGEEWEVLVSQKDADPLRVV